MVFRFCSSSPSRRIVVVSIVVAGVTSLILKHIDRNATKTVIFQQGDTRSLTPEIIAECEHDQGSIPEVKECSTIDVAATKVAVVSDADLVDPLNDVDDKASNEIIHQTQKLEEVTMTHDNERFVVEQFRVEGYFCKNGQESDSTVGQDGPVRQGQVVKICVRPVQQNLTNFVRMKRIVSFTWTRQDKDTNTDVQQQQQQQVAVKNGVAASNGLTELFCTSGYAICYVETVLLASFFTSSTNIIGYGVVDLQFSGEQSTTSVSPRQRQRHPIVLQQELDSGIATAAATASFDMVLRVQKSAET
mmetsp:Transcript_60433/g.148295  ORF Transcript_60433/g.148295 Transcript_60433/m.148295 type:complete len:303 (+) Transcript_60433:287-1195(+)|eukprot:CAMPEP_0113460704 /NCGR_PEP_ID=MMETSP0014_2-20120614/11134_1 /TAXON_ID=2857 /ORGANISM="Nitzschia sp." /LENGTH=302 /DNA_ID=CAMNT_0000352385 /DNA_START=152 /DNA_END=1060 /DNA_ORIENTATION=- /assembly_acc=CAM_ASM_000159